MSVRSWRGPPSVRGLTSASFTGSTNLVHFTAGEIWTDLESALGSRGQVFAECNVGHPHLVAVAPACYGCVLEGQTEVEVAGRDTAFIVFIACHSVFNVRFGRGAKGMGVYIQRELGVDDGQKLTPRAVHEERRALQRSDVAGFDGVTRHAPCPPRAVLVTQMTHASCRMLNAVGLFKPM